jgi:MGT family glycosyltransferase
LVTHIFMAALGTPGHVNPTLAVAEGLVRNGYDVSYCTTRWFRRAVEAIGAKHVPYDSLLGDDPSGIARVSAMGAFSYVEFLKDSLHILPQIEEQLRTRNVDLLVYDRWCAAARWAAERAGVPKAGCLSTYAQNAHFYMPEHYGRLPGVPRVDTAEERKAAEAEAARLEVCDRFQSLYGVTVAPVRELVMRSDPLNIVFLPRSFQIAGDTFDSRYVFVGPCIGSRVHEHGKSAGGSPRSRPRLLIARGSILTDAPDFYRTCVQAFEGTAWDVFMGIGRDSPLTLFARVPANFSIAPELPQLSLLPTAQAFIGAGGMNSIMESLRFGVPFVAVPDTPEQFINAHRIASLGVGRFLSMKELSPGQLRDTVESLATAASTRANLQKMQESIKSAGGVSAAVEAIRKYVESLSTVQRARVG